MIFSKHLHKSLLILIVLAGLCFNCAPVLQRSAINPDETRWQVIPKILEGNYTRLQTLKGSGKLVVETKEISYSANSTIVYKKPDSVMIKVEAIFGIDVGSLFADRNAYKVYVPSHNTCYFGKSESLEKNEFIAFNMDYERLMQSVTGLNLASDISNGILRRVGDDLILYGKNNGNFIKYWIDPKLGVVKKAETVDENKKTILVEEYSRFIKVNGVVLPQTIKIKRPQRKESFTLFYENLKANTKLKQKDFVLNVPKSAHKIML